MVRIAGHQKTADQMESGSHKGLLWYVSDFEDDLRPHGSSRRHGSNRDCVVCASRDQDRLVLVAQDATDLSQRAHRPAELLHARVGDELANAGHGAGDPSQRANPNLSIVSRHAR